MDLQTLLILPIVAVAGYYVARALWPSKKKQSGCSACPQNRARRDDYA